jgi:hypothetical protein
LRPNPFRKYIALSFAVMRGNLASLQ